MLVPELQQRSMYQSLLQLYLKRCFYPRLHKRPEILYWPLALIQRTAFLKTSPYELHLVECYFREICREAL